MNLYLRLLWALILIAGRPRIGMQTALADFTQIPLMTFPNDLDLNMHVNNGRIVTLMDLGMLHLMGRAGLIRGMLKYRLRPVIGGAILRYRRSLRVFERFNAGTRLLGWDLRWFYFEHRLQRANGQDVATAIVRTCLIGQTGVISPSDAMAKLGLGSFAPQRGTVGEMFDAAVIFPA